MRIVQLITRPQRRGAEIFAVQLAEQLLSLGHEVYVISILKGSGDLFFSGSFIQLDLLDRGKIDVSGFRKLAAKINEIQPEIIQANAAVTLLYAVGVKYFSKADFKLLYRNANKISSFIRNKAQLVFNQLLHRQLDAVISVSENSKEDYLTLFNPKHILAIPIGIDPIEIEEKLKVKTNLSAKDYLLFVGSLVPEKDPLGLLDIFKFLLQTRPDLKLKFLGSGPLEEELRDKIKFEGLEERVEIIPNQSNIFPILSAAKMLCMPSKIEGLPGVILEAMYCEIPVIAYDVGGISEVVKNNETGWLVEERDSQAFINALSEALSTPSKNLNRIISNAKKLVKENYQIDQIAKKFERFYLDLI